MRRISFLVLILAALWPPVGMVAAQTSATELLPDGEQFGSGWTSLERVGTVTGPPSAFTSVAHGVYVGPRGTRLIAAVYVIANGMNELTAAWERGNSDFESYRALIGGGNDPQREDNLALEPLPKGCSDGRRTSGIEHVGYGKFLVGLSLCIVETDLMVLAFVSGPVGGGGGYEASDAAVAVIVAGANAVTSEAG